MCARNQRDAARSSSPVASRPLLGPIFGAVDRTKCGLKDCLAGAVGRRQMVPVAKYEGPIQMPPSQLSDIRTGPSIAKSSLASLAGSHSMLRSNVGAELAADLHERVVDVACHRRHSSSRCERDQGREQSVLD